MLSQRTAPPLKTVTNDPVVWNACFFTKYTVSGPGEVNYTTCPGQGRSKDKKRRDRQRYERKDTLGERKEVKPPTEDVYADDGYSSVLHIRVAFVSIRTENNPYTGLRDATATTRVVQRLLWLKSWVS